jgi:hypothetical protein
MMSGSRLGATIRPSLEVSDATRRARVGWVNVVVAAVMMVATLPGRTQGLGLITEPLLRDLHLDRVLYANINLWATLLGALVCLPFGWVFDRFGLRLPTATIVVLLAATVGGMRGQSGDVVGLFTLILFTRALGQSALSVASITAVGKSFDRSVGLAMGVYSVLVGLFFAAAFAWVGGAVTTSGWRVAWAEVALALVVVAPLVVLFLRIPKSCRVAEEARLPLGSRSRHDGSFQQQVKPTWIHHTKTRSADSTPR